MAQAEYTEDPACGALASRVERLWHLVHPGDDTAQLIAPDGACEIILHRAGPPQEWRDGQWCRQAPAFLYGPLDRALRLQQSGPMDVIGIRLHPWAVGALGPRPTLWRNRPVPLAEIIGPDRATALHALARRADDVSVFQAAAAGLLADILPRSAAQDAARPLVEALRKGEPCAVAGLAQHAGVTERTISRRFERACGLSARTMVRIFRFHRARDAIKQGVDLGDAAALAGYADQAHMTRDFRHFAGITPVPARQPATYDVFYAGQRDDARSP